MPPRTDASLQKLKQRQEKLPGNLDWLPSVSRSSGVQDDGDSLKQYAVQETYRRWIDEKLLEYEHTGQTSTDNAKLNREDIIRRFRKLREGVMASNRRDEFATEVYESSLYLAAAYGIPEQVTAVAAKILPPSLLSSAISHAELSKDEMPREFTLFLILVHHVFLASRSTSSRQWIVSAISHPLVSKNISSARLHWLQQTRLAWRIGNYHVIWDLTSMQTIDSLLEDIWSPGVHGKRERAAIIAEVEAIRVHTRDTAWAVMRAAYREERESWFLHSLSLPREDTAWISHKQQLQEALFVAGDQRRWKVYRPRT